MKRVQTTMLVIAGAALSANLIAQPANASAASDAATRYAASIYAQQQGLPSNSYDMQQAAQKGYGNGGYGQYNTNYGGYGVPYAPYATPYGGGYGGYPNGGYGGGYGGYGGGYGGW